MKQIQRSLPKSLILLFKFSGLARTTDHPTGALTGGAFRFHPKYPRCRVH